MATAVQALSWAERLRAVGLRVTQPRLAVLDVVHADPHLSADQVAERVRSGIGAVSTQAIYDALNTLTEHHILRRFEPAGSAMKFEVATGDNHHHLVCRTCGTCDRRAVRGRVDAVRDPRGHPRLPGGGGRGHLLGDLPDLRQRPSDHLRHSRSTTHNFILTTGGQTSSQQPPLKE